MVKKKEDFRVVPCSGCGRYHKSVDSKVVNWYCSNCFLGNGNFFRAQSGKKLVKPISKVKKGTKVKTVFGREGTVCGVGYIMDKTTYYIIEYPDSKVPVEFIGDYQIIV